MRALLYEHSTRACYVCPLVAVPSRTPGFVMWRVEPEGRRVLGVLGLDSLRSWSADTSLRPGRGRGRLEARAGGWRADAVSCTCGSGPPPPLLLRPVRPLSVGGRLDPTAGALSLLAVGTFRSWRCCKRRRRWEGGVQGGQWQWHGEERFEGGRGKVHDTPPPTHSSSTTHTHTRHRAHTWPSSSTHLLEQHDTHTLPRSHLAQQPH